MNNKAKIKLTCFFIFVLVALTIIMLKNHIDIPTLTDAGNSARVSRSGRDNDSTISDRTGAGRANNKRHIKFFREPRTPIDSSLLYTCKLNNDGTLTVATLEHLNIPKNIWGEVQNEINILLQRERELVVKNTTLLTTSENEKTYVVERFDESANLEIDDFSQRISNISNPESSDFISRIIDNSMVNFNHGRLESRIIVRLDKNIMGNSSIKSYEVNYYDSNGEIIATSKLGRESFLQKYGRELVDHLDTTK